ncbi:MAG: S-layer homology domain-containing protein [Bacillota bacterium]
MKKNLVVKRVSTLALATVISAAQVPVFAATDINGHWAETTLTKWTDEGLLTGFPDGTVKPDASVTRAQFVTMIQNAMGLSTVGSANFTDVNSGDWFYGAVSTAVSYGIASGFPDGSFLPNTPVTRAQAAVFGANALGDTSVGSIANYTDAASIPSWAAEAVGAMTAKGYLSGMPDGSFDPNAYLTRAQAVSFLDRLRDGTSTNNTYTNETIDVTETETEIDEDTSSSSTSTDGSTGGSSGGSSSTSTGSSSSSSSSTGGGGTSSDNTTTPDADTGGEEEVLTAVGSGVSTLADLEDALAGTTLGDEASGFKYHEDDDYIIILEDFDTAAAKILTITKDTIIYVENGAVVSNLTFEVDGAEVDFEIRNYDELTTEATAMAVFSLISSEAPVLGGLTITSGNSAVATIAVDTVTVNGSIDTLTVGNVTDKLQIIGTVGNVVATGTVEKIEIDGEITVLEVADVTGTFDIMGTVENIVATGTVEKINVIGEGGGEVSSVVADGGTIKDLSISAIESVGGDILVDPDSSENLDSSDSSDVFVYLLEENTGEIHCVSTTVNVAVSSTNAEITVPISASLGVKIDLVGDDTVVEIIAQSNVEITSEDTAVATKITTSSDSITVDVPVTEEIIATNCNEATIILGTNGSTPTITVGDSVVILTVDLTDTSPLALDQIDVTTTTTTAVEVKVATVGDVKTAIATGDDAVNNIIVTKPDSISSEVKATVTTTDETATTEAEKSGTITPTPRITTPIITSTTTVGTDPTLTTLPFGTDEATVTIGMDTVSGSQNVVIYYTTDANVDLAKEYKDYPTNDKISEATNAEMTISDLVTGENVVYAIAVNDGGDTERLDSAIGTLTFTVEEPDFNALNDAIDSANNLQLGLYDQSSELITAFADALEEAKKLLTTAKTQTQIGTATTALTDAQTALSTALLDRNALDVAITNVGIWITDNSAKYNKENQAWVELESLLTSAEELSTITTLTTQTAIDGMTTQINALFTDMEIKLVDALLTYDNLSDIIDSADDINVDDPAYTDDLAKATFATTLADAKTLLDTLDEIFKGNSKEEVTQAEINAMADELAVAITALDSTKLNTDALKSAITTATDLTDENYKYDPTNDYWLTLVKALATAEGIVKNTADYIQTEINTATSELSSAIGNVDGALLIGTTLESTITEAKKKVSDGITNKTLEANLETAIADGEALLAIIDGTDETDARTTQSAIDAASAILSNIINDIYSASVTIASAVASADGQTVTVTFTATVEENVKFYVSTTNTTPDVSVFTGDAVEATGSSQTTELTIPDGGKYVFATIGDNADKITDAVAIESELTNLIVGTMKIVAVDGTNLSESTNAEDADDTDYATTTTSEKTLGYEVELYNTDGVLIPTTTTFDYLDENTNFYGQIYWELAGTDGVASIQDVDDYGFFQGEAVKVTTAGAGTVNLIINFIDWTGTQGGIVSEYVEITVTA